MYYDTLIYSEIDNLYDKIKKNIDINVIIKNLENIEKVINFNLFKEISTKIDNKFIDEYFKITKAIFSNYLVCILVILNKTKIDEIKSKVINLKTYKSDELGNMFNLSDDAINLQYVVNEENLEKLRKEYDINVKVKNAVDLANNLGFEWVANNLQGKKDINIHNIAKTIILKNFFHKLFRKRMFSIITSKESTYDFIDIVVPQLKIIDYNNIDSILSSNEKKDNLSQDIFDFIGSFEKKQMIDYEVDHFINILISNKIIVPIIDDFLRYHKINEKYEKNTSKINENERDNKKDQTKIRYIISKTDKIKDYYSKKIQNNSSLKKEVEKQFYKPLQYRKAVIINEIEELTIINKLRKQGKTAIESNEFFYDLVNLRKSAYVNFKDFKKYGFNFLTTESVTGIRYSMIEALEENNLTSKNIFVETRVLGKNTRSNIVGFAILKDNLETLKIKDLMNIRDKKQDNAYNIFVDKLKNYVNGNLDKNYYWIFDVNTDIKKTEFYERINTEEYKSGNLLKLLIKYLHDDLLFIIYNKIYNEIEKHNQLYLYNSYKFIDYYQRKFIDIDKFIDKENYYNKIKNFIYTKIPVVESIYDDEEDKIYGFTGNFKKIPMIKQDIKKISSVTIGPKIVTEKKEDNYTDNAQCQHIIDWNNLSMLRNKNPNKHTLLLYNFIEKYAMQNNDNEYVCKSCKQLLDISSFLSSTYDGGTDGIDIVIASSSPLEDVYEYSKFKASINYMHKIIERISQITNFSYFIGNQSIHKYRRQEIIKLSIDIITVHDETLRTTDINKRERERLATQNYGISPDNSNYFIFPLSNDIFKFSSKEIDKFKKIKLNNIISYIIFMMILELNLTQIINIEFDKNCNLYLFEKFGLNLFDNLFIRYNNSNNVVKIRKYEGLCLVIFYFACMISKYNLWYHPLSDTNNFSVAMVQKDIIHTMVDLINSILEVNSKEEKHYLYKILGSRFFNKLSNVYSTSEIIEYIKKKESKRIVIDNTTNKIRFSKSKIKSIELTGKLSKIDDNLYNLEKCNYLTYYIKKAVPERDMYNIIGKDLLKIREDMMTENMRKLAMIYGKDGNKLKNKLNLDDVMKISKKDLENIIKNIKPKFQKKIQKNLLIKNIKNEYNDVKDKIDKTDYVNKLLNLINAEIGPTIKINSIIYHLEDSQYLIDHDYLGNDLSKNIYLYENDKKIKVKFNEEMKLKIYEINDKSNDVILYYNYHTMHLIGYKDSTRGFVNMKSFSRYLKFIPSIKMILKTLGFKKLFYDADSTSDIKNVIRSASLNLKDYIRQIITGLNQIRYKINNVSANRIVLHYQKKISDIELRGEKGKVFKNWNNFLKLNSTQIKIPKDFNTDKVSSLEISEFSSSYNEIISYFISQVLLVIEYNQSKFIRSNLIFFFLSYIIYLYYNNFEQYTDFEMVKFNYILDLYDDFTNNVESIYSDEERENLTEEQKNELEEQKQDDDEWASALDVDVEGQGDEDDEEVLFENLDISGRTSLY